MKRNKSFKVVIIIIFLIIINHVYCNFFTIGMLIGDYYNVNFSNSPAVETSRNPDTLKLIDDNSFYSGFYGAGVYKINYTLLGTVIDLHYNSGTASIETSIKRNWFGKPKIIMFEDIDHYYKKLD